MPGPLALLAIAGGAQLLGGIFKTQSERSRLQDLRGQLEAAIAPLEADARGRRFGSSQSTGSLTRRVTRNTLEGLGERGVLDSSFAAPAVAEAVAPIEAAETGRRLQSEERIASAKFAIAEGTSLPGFGSAFGGALEDLGSFLSLQAGRQAGKGAREKTALDKFAEDTISATDETLRKVGNRPKFQFGPQSIEGR